MGSLWIHLPWQAGQVPHDARLEQYQENQHHDQKVSRLDGLLGFIRHS